MKYALFSYTGDCFPLAYRLQKEGHDVVVGHVRDPKDVHADDEKLKPEVPLDKERRLSVYDGMLEKKDAWELLEMLEKQKDPSEWFVFFDRNSLFKFASRCEKLACKGNFPTEQDYRWEMDRESAKSFVRKHYNKLRVGEVKEFSSIKDAKEFLKTTDEIWVLKGKEDVAKTFVPDVDDKELAAGQILRALEENEAYARAGFILEPMISRVIELTPERIYYDGVLVAASLDVENKPFGSGNVSVQTGCAQDLVFPIPVTERINEIAFPPIVDELAKKRKGLFYWDASILIDRRTRAMYFGEFCSNRPGYNCLFTEIAMCPSAHHYFSSIAAQKNPFDPRLVGTSVTLFNPDIEETTSHPPPGAPIEYKEGIEKNLWLWDVKKQGKKLVSAGDDWNLAVITGAGKSIEDAVKSMYAAVDDFSFVGSYYRPKFDYLSLDYPTSIVNRLNYGMERGLYDLPFDVKVGHIA